MKTYIKTYFTLFLTILSLFFSLIFNDLQAQMFPTPPQKVPVLTQPSTIKTNAISILNSTYDEVNPNISPDGKYLFFMSKRGGMTWSATRDAANGGGFDGDIWFSQKINGNWSAPASLGATVNTFDGEDEPNISPDGQTVAYQSWKDWSTRSGPYYKAALQGTYWGTPQPLGGGIHQFFMNEDVKGVSQATDGMAISPDGNTFIVALGDYVKNMDLYISFRVGGVWSYLTKLNISTPYNERAPFIAADGKTLYFASNGYTSAGGLDIFKGTLNANGTVTDVVNIGAPFNTAQNDQGFILTADGKEAYFVRNGDIYYADITNSPKIMKPKSTLIIEGVVTSKRTKKPINAEIVFKADKTNKIIASNAYTGKYVLVLEKTDLKQLNQAIKKVGYTPYMKAITVTNDDNSEKITLNIELEDSEESIKQREEIAKKKEDLLKKQREEIKKREDLKTGKTLVQQKYARREAMAEYPR